MSERIRRTYVDENVNVMHDDMAKFRTEIKNDSKYLDDTEGVSKVDLERWKSAQKYERKTWMEIMRTASDDRNMEHAERFKGYNEFVNYINKKEITELKMIELGCGPFTNTRVVVSTIPNVNVSCSLLDPLLNDYLNHANCTYKGKVFNGKSVDIYSTPIEEFEQKENEYDVVLMNNVLEHCYDINIIFDKILSMLKPGGVMIFSDVYFYKEDMQELLEKRYDTGHPLKLSEKLMNDFLSNFEALSESDFHGLYNEPWRNDKYYIGVKK